MDASWLSAKWRVTTDWIYAKCADHEIPYVRIGRYIRFDPVQIAAYEASASHPAKPVPSEPACRRGRARQRLTESREGPKSALGTSRRKTTSR